MGRGRPAKPTVIKLLDGNPGRRPIGTGEPRPDATPPECPDWLSPAAKRKWQEVAPELARLGLLTCIDGDALAAYCQAWAEFELATRTLDREGRVVTTTSGYRLPHPAVAQQRSAWAAVRAFASLFGLDPSSRSRMKAPAAADEADPFEAFVKGKGKGKKKA